MKIGGRAGNALFLPLLFSWTKSVAPSPSVENITEPNQGWPVPENTPCFESYQPSVGSTP